MHPTHEQRRRQRLERDLAAVALFPEHANLEAVAYLLEELARLRADHQEPAGPVTTTRRR